MHILALSPEYPPLQVGGLARHVEPLYREMVDQGHQVTLVTQKGNGAKVVEEREGVEIFRVDPLLVHGPDFISSVLQLNFQLVQKAGQLAFAGYGFDLIHGHDWLVSLACKTMKHMLKIPLVMTIHATEHGRNHGVHNEMQRYINDLEWLACYEAWRVIVCSQYMRREIQYLFQVPEDKIDIIKNGVTPADFRSQVSEDFRQFYAHPDEKIVFFIGRLVQEKGVHILIDAIPQVLEEFPDTKFVIAGRGPKEGELKYQASHLGVYDRCYFTGFIDDATRNQLYQVCDLAVFPSLYEPFGIVALEAMAARVPVLVTEVGGMAEIVEDGVDGFKVKSGSAHELAQGIKKALENPTLIKNMCQKGYQKVKEDFSWSGIATKTEQVYQRILREYQDSSWRLETEKEEKSPDLSENQWTHRYQLAGK